MFGKLHTLTIIQVFQILKIFLLKRYCRFITIKYCSQVGLHSSHCVIEYMMYFLIFLHVLYGDWIYMRT